MTKQNIVKLLFSIAICHLAGFVGSFFTRPAIETWYALLEKPAFSPPNWLFAPAWLTLYTLMGIALYLVWQKGLHQKNARRAFVLFLVHLLFNAFWSVAFFGLESPFWALIVIVLLWLFILWLVGLFSRVSKAAAYLLIPYWLWVSFAAALNFAIWQLN